MPSLQIISSCLQIVESSTFRRRTRRSKSSKPKTASSGIPFSPRITLLKPFDSAYDANPLLPGSRSNTAASMLSVATITGAYTLSTAPSLFPSISLAKSETCLPDLPSLMHYSHTTATKPTKQADRDLPKFEAIPSVNIHETASHRLDLSPEAFSRVDYLSDEPNLSMWESPSLTERNSTAEYSLSNALELPDSAPGSRQEKDEHEVYLDSLRLLNFGENSIVVGKDFLSEGISSSLMQHGDAASWEDIDLKNYGWHV